MAQYECKTQWQSGMSFKVQIDKHQLIMDARSDQGGKDLGPNPKQLMLSSITGCSGMDVASLVKKMKIPVERFEMNAKTHTTEGHPSVFAEVQVDYLFWGKDMDVAALIKAVTLSMTKYCGISAMVAEICPLNYRVFVNETEMHSAQANFQIPGF